ncbi:MAG: 5-formyltetrahydrofolate cyclo-ligase [Paracoccaceae bacterium]
MSQDGIAARKAALRTAAYATRKRAHAAAGHAADRAAEAFLALALHPGIEVVAGYRPIRTEIDPTPLMLRFLALGHRLAVPVIEAPGRPLAFREWTPDAPMVAGPFGAEIPAKGAWLVPRLLIVPLLAFDREGGRLGYGGGFYDRTLEKLRADSPTRAVGVAYAAQEVPTVPREATDARLDAIVTEGGAIRVGPASDPLPSPPGAPGA